MMGVRAAPVRAAVSQRHGREATHTLRPAAVAHTQQDARAGLAFLPSGKYSIDFTPGHASSLSRKREGVSSAFGTTPFSWAIPSVVQRFGREPLW